MICSFVCFALENTISHKCESQIGGDLGKIAKGLLIHCYLLLRVSCWNFNRTQSNRTSGYFGPLLIFKLFFGANIYRVFTMHNHEKC